MKIIVTFFCLFSFINTACATTNENKEKSNTYWKCQCWQDVKSGSSDMLLEFESEKNKSRLEEAQIYALKECKENDSSISVATCLKWTRADH